MLGRHLIALLHHSGSLVIVLLPHSYLGFTGSICWWPSLISSSLLCFEPHPQPPCTELVIVVQALTPGPRRKIPQPLWCVSCRNQPRTTTQRLDCLALSPRCDLLRYCDSDTSLWEFWPLPLCCGEYIHPGHTQTRSHPPTWWIAHSASHHG